MDIEFVRSRFIKHFDGTTLTVLLAQYMPHQDVSTLSVNIQTIMVDSFSLVQLTKV